jgi:hypothetical protein
MKRIFILTFSLFCCFNIFSQNENSDTTFIYGEIQGIQKNGSQSLSISILIEGQKITYFLDEQGKKHIFNQMYEAMNWLAKDGWEFIQSYSTSYVREWEYSSNDYYSVIHYVIKRKK